MLHYCCLFSIWTTRKMHDFQGYFSRTFLDLKLKFPRLSRTKVIFQDFPGPGIFKEKNPGLSRRRGNPRPFDLWTGAECQPWHGQPSCQFGFFCDFLLSTYGQARIGLTTWPYYLDIWPLTSPGTSVTWVIILHPVPSFKFVGIPFRRNGTFSVGAIIDLETLTFDL